MGIVRALRCPRCGWESPSRTTFHCSDCAEVLEAIIEISHLSQPRLLEIRRRPDQTIWRWFEFLPIEDRSFIVSLGEGYTPLLHSQRLSQTLGITRLYLKNDTVLPTGSLKDRSNAVALSKAKELGFKTAAVVSTGNAAASVAAYAAAAGLRSVVMVPQGTSPSKMAQASAYGATVLVVEGDFENAAGLYKKAVQEFGWYDCLSSNPYRNEGKKSYAYELLDQLEAPAPGWIIHPTAGGTGIFAIWKGYNELLSLGLVDRLPKLVAAQSEAAAPFAVAFKKGLSEIEPVVARDTVAESIQVGYPKSMGGRALEAIRNSKGVAVAVTDEEILKAQAQLACLAGIFAEPAGAVSVAAASLLRTQGVIGQDELVVCNITGHGLKQPFAIQVPEEQLRPIPPDIDALRRQMKKGQT